LELPAFTTMTRSKKITCKSTGGKATK